MLLLIASGVAFCLFHGLSGHGTATVGLGELGIVFWPLALLALTGTANAVNITDGLDGLAGEPAPSPLPPSG